MHRLPCVIFASYLTGKCPDNQQGKTKHRFLFVTAKKIVVILCNDEGGKISPREEETITAQIEELLGQKGLIFWWKRSTRTKQSVFYVPLNSLQNLA